MNASNDTLIRDLRIAISRRVSRLRHGGMEEDYIDADRIDMEQLLASLEAADWSKARRQLRALDTVVRDDVPQSIFDALFPSR